MYDFKNELPLSRKPINLQGMEMDMKTYTINYVVPRNMRVSDLCYHLYKEFSCEEMIYYMNFVQGFIAKDTEVKVVNPKYLKSFKVRYENGFGYQDWSS